MNEVAQNVAAWPVRHVAPILLTAVSLALLVSPYPYLAPAPGLAVLFLLWFGRRPVRALFFYGIVLLIPFGSFRALGGDLSMLRLHWIFAAVLAFLLAAELVLRKAIPDELRNGRFWALIFAFYTINIVSALGSQFPAVSFVFMLLLAAGYLLVALGMVLIDEKGYMRTLPIVVLGSMFLSSIFTLLGYIAGLELFVSQETGRVVAGAPDPNNLALMIIFSLPMAAYFLVTVRSALMRFGLLAIIGIQISAVMMTFSRGGGLILLLSILIILWEFRRMIAPRNLGLLTGLAGLAVCVLILIAPENYGARLKSIQDPEDFAMNRRMSYLVVAQDLVRERPLLGSGPDTYSSMYAETDLGRSYKRKGETGRRMAHNTYIEVLTGTGIIGFTFFALILVYALRSFNRAKTLFLRRGKGEAALLTVAYRTAFVTLLLYLFFFSDVTHKYLLLSLALSQVALRLAHQGPERGEIRG